MSHQKKFDQTMERINEDEPIFILRGQDCLAPMVVEEWCELAAKLKVDPKKILDAYQCADAMRKWSNRRLPD